MANPDGPWLRRIGAGTFFVVAAATALACGVVAFFIVGLAATGFEASEGIVLSLAFLAFFGALTAAVAKMRKVRGGRREARSSTNNSEIVSDQLRQEATDPGAAPTKPMFGKIPARYSVGAAVALGFIVLLGTYFGNSLGLEVEWQRGQLINGVAITNVGSRPIKLLDIVINDRPECRTGLFAGGPSGPMGARDLAMGDRAVAYTNCEVVRVSIKTDRGNAVYHFGR